MKKRTLIESIKKQNEKNPFFSIVITSYEDKNYIEECMASILTQGLDTKDFELIFTNDASNDGTVELIQDFMQTHPEVNARLIVNEENIGLGPSRNRAIDVANGQFIPFVDADDWLSPDGLKNAKETIEATGADLLLTKMSRFKDTPEVAYDIKPLPDLDAEKINQLSGNDFFGELEKSQMELLSSSVNIFSKDLIADGMRFENMPHEDILWTLDLQLKSENPKLCWNDYYNYRKRAGTITSTNFSERARTLRAISRNAESRKISFPNRGGMIDGRVKTILDFADRVESDANRHKQKSETETSVTTGLF